MIATGEELLQIPSNDKNYDYFISCKIVFREVKVLIAEHFSRAANGGIELLKPQVIMLHNFTQPA
jgi:hypothetical protein